MIEIFTGTHLKSVISDVNNFIKTKNAKIKDIKLNTCAQGTAMAVNYTVMIIYE